MWTELIRWPQFNSMISKTYKMLTTVYMIVSVGSIVYLGENDSTMVYTLHKDQKPEIVEIVIRTAVRWSESAIDCQ